MLRTLLLVSLVLWTLGAPLAAARAACRRAAGAARAPADPFRTGLLGACLSDAQRQLRVHRRLLERLDRWLAEARPDRALSVGTVVYPASPFAPFEGAWQGRWGRLPVRQLWWSVSPDTQLVVVEDAGQRQLAINHAYRGQLCGVVQERDGRDRLHAGRLLDGPQGPQLVWTTPERTYLERVVYDRDGAAYEIVELLSVGAAPVLGHVVRYRRLPGDERLRRNSV